MVSCIGPMWSHLNTLHPKWTKYINFKWLSILNLKLQSGHLIEHWSSCWVSRWRGQDSDTNYPQGSWAKRHGLRTKFSIQRPHQTQILRSPGLSHSGPTGYIFRGLHYPLAFNHMLEWCTDLKKDLVLRSLLYYNSKRTEVRTSPCIQMGDSIVLEGPQHEDSLSSPWRVSMGHSPGTLMCGCAQIIG